MVIDANAAREDYHPSRRQLLRSTTGLLAAAGVASSSAVAQPFRGTNEPLAKTEGAQTAMHRQKMIGYMLAHEQFSVPELVGLGASAAQAGFNLLATSDHLQPWQANEGHCGAAWVTLGAVGDRARPAWIGTTVTCPTLRYNPAVVAETFATLGLLYPGRVFLGVGSGEALNEQAATGAWPAWPERWERLVEAVEIIRALWAGEHVSHKGKYYTVDAKLYDPPPQPIPLLTAANGRKSMRLAGQHGDGLITDPKTWQQYKSEWEVGAHDAGKDPAQMRVLVEQFVVVGDKTEAARAAELWRFIPRAFKKYYNNQDPAAIQQQANSDIPIDKILDEWPIGTDPAVHIAAIEKLFDSGATIVNVHSGQQDQKKVVEFYGASVLPNFKHRS